MSVFMALLLAATPNATPAAEPAQAKPRKKCEYVSEVGSNRPRRICQVIMPKAPDDHAKADVKQEPTTGSAPQQSGAEQ